MIPLLKFLLLLSVLGVAYFNGYAQKNIAGRIIAKDLSPVPYANVLRIGYREGAISNEEGHFSLKVNPGDSILISAIGFASQKTLASALVKDSVVVLATSVTELTSIVIKEKKGPKKIFEIGYHRAKNSSRLVTRSAGFQVATYFPNRVKDDSKIEFVKSFVAKIRSPKPSRIRLRFYKPNYFNGPISDLLHEEILIDLHNKIGKVNVPLKEKNILFPKEGIVVAIEFIGNLDKMGRVKKDKGEQIGAYIMLSRDDIEYDTWISFMNRSWSQKCFSYQ
jgi:hypothetical protein